MLTFGSLESKPITSTLSMKRNLTEDILYIGTDDTTIEKFESQYIVPEGMAYNSYLILDEKVAIMDTVDARKGEEWKAGLEEALSGAQPDYLVVQHLEPDHSSLIQWVVETYPGVTVVASAKALSMLGQFFPTGNFEGRTLAVKEGDTLSLGRHSLMFFMAPMVHWPEVMVSFEELSGTLFAADAFGKFGALSKCGFYGGDDSDWACEGRRYYFNICGKYGAPVQALLRKVLPLPISRICSLHGPILDDDLGYYINLYDTWSSYGVESEGVVVAYASIHGGTGVVAGKIAEMIRERGVKAVLCNLCDGDPAEDVEDAFRYGKLIVAACSYDAGLFPPAHEFIHHLQDKAYQNRTVGLVENGSWAPSAGRVMKEMFSSMKNVKIVEPLVTIKSRMKEEDIPSLRALVDAVLM